MNRIEQCQSAAIALHTALARTTCLRQRSPEQDALWRVLQATICTRGHTIGTAWGSDTAQDIGGEDARQNELVAAMMWLIAREDVARQMKPDHLFRHLRAVAVRSRLGSARAIQADALHGMTGVTSDAPVQFVLEAMVTS
ncbi:hypothetical protein [Segeticoccus rhizosphaerae]|uniref:hypothetical protein n=1 Tax=Segeticoccus rhizosphaerae TaxID=1104777 RepID=UPI001263F1F8|nr:hypothetical protein [Segeticoccus rhizosphaerae]